MVPEIKLDLTEYVDTNKIIWNKKYSAIAHVKSNHRGRKISRKNLTME